MNKKNLLMSAAVAGLCLIGAGCATQNATAETGKCYGVNSCKGHGDCGGKNHSCSGKNSCKGKGFKKLDKTSCATKGGKFARMR